MSILVQSLSWTLIYSLGQGFVVYAALWLVLKLMPGTPSGVKYHLSLSALTILFAWFAVTLWQQFHVASYQQSFVALAHNGVVTHPLTNIGATQNYGWYGSFLSIAVVIFPWLSAFYVIGLALLLVRLSAGMLHLFSLRKTGVIQPDKAVGELMISLKSKLQYHGSVQLLISIKAQVPMVIGVLKPIILVPAAAMTQLSTEQLETILMHELVHLKRHDYLVNILQTIVETILFFNPFVWMVSAVIRREREHCCDDEVLQHTREPRFYATALAALATDPVPFSRLSVAASGQSNHLFNRIIRIMEMKKNQFSYSRMVAAIVIISALACSIAWIRPTLPRTGKNKPAAAASTANTGSTANLSEESQLVNQLQSDGRIDQVKGFIVEKKQNQLFIDGKQLPADVASKYISTLKKDEIRVQVYPFMERLRQHPDAGFIEVLLPVMFSSPCVDYKPKEPGC